MKELETNLVVDALRATGELLGPHGDPVELVLAGGVAGLLGGLLAPSRTTSDCDVMSIKDSKHWKEGVRAASEVAKRLELPDEWLNRQCAMYAWMLPLQFVDRCEEVGTFGRLRVVRLSRLDLIATKVMGAPKRPQDLEDLRHMKPTAAELEFVSANVDRLEAENLDGATFESERAILTDLGDGIGDGNGGDA